MTVNQKKVKIQSRLTIFLKKVLNIYVFLGTRIYRDIVYEILYNPKNYENVKNIIAKTNPKKIAN